MSRRSIESITSVDDITIPDSLLLKSVAYPIYFDFDSLVINVACRRQLAHRFVRAFCVWW